LALLSKRTSSPKTPIVIGLTGNMGTGKSSVLQVLAKLGAQIIDADKLAHEVIALGGPAYAAVEVYSYE